MYDAVDLEDLARRAIRQCGSKAGDEMERRASAHEAIHNYEGAAVWRRVAQAARRILKGRNERRATPARRR